MSKPTAAELELFDLLAKCNSLFVEVAVVARDGRRIAKDRECPRRLAAHGERPSVVEEQENKFEAGEK